MAFVRDARVEILRKIAPRGIFQARVGSCALEYVSRTVLIVAGAWELDYEGPVTIIQGEVKAKTLIE